MGVVIRAGVDGCQGGGAMKRRLLRLSSRRRGSLIETLGPATCAVESVKLQKYVAAIGTRGFYIRPKR